jgi:hypothetical protein
MAETQPKLQPALLEIVSDDFPILHGGVPKDDFALSQLFDAAAENKPIRAPPKIAANEIKRITIWAI